MACAADQGRWQTWLWVACALAACQLTCSEASASFSTASPSAGLPVAGNLRPCFQTTAILPTGRARKAQCNSRSPHRLSSSLLHMDAKGRNQEDDLCDVLPSRESSRRAFLAAGASFTAGTLSQGLSPASAELTPFAQQIANDVTPGGKGTEINGKILQSECRGSRGQSCNVWSPPEIAKSPQYAGPKAEITTKVYLDLRIIRDYTKEVLEDGVLRGRVVFGLYGKASPKTVSQFMQFVQNPQSPLGPTFSSSMFFRQEAGKWLEGGRINGLSKTEIAGVEEYEWMGKVVNLSPALEVNSLKHDSGMLLSHRKFNPGPEFCVTLAPSPELDAQSTVFGEVLEGQELILEMAKLPFVTGKSLDPTGSPSDQWWQAQNRYFQSLAKQLGDTRVSNKFPGKLLRRVEVTKCGLA